jgi:hypothetical protein
MGEVVFGLIEQAVTQACTNNGEDKHINEKLIQRIVSHLLTSIDTTHDKISNKKSQRPKQAVPTDRKASNGKKYWVNVPSDVV